MPAVSCSIEAGLHDACKLDAGRNAGFIQTGLMQANSWRQDVDKLALNMGIVTTTRENNRIWAINSSIIWSGIQTGTPRGCLTLTPPRLCLYIKAI